MVSLLVQIPEELYESMQRYLDTHPECSQDRAFQAALSLFLLQNGGDRTASSPNWGLQAFVPKSQHEPEECRSITRKAYTPSPNWGLQAFLTESQHEDEGL